MAWRAMALISSAPSGTAAAKPAAKAAKAAAAAPDARARAAILDDLGQLAARLPFGHFFALFRPEQQAYAQPAKIGAVDHAKAVPVEEAHEKGRLEPVGVKSLG